MISQALLITQYNIYSTWYLDIKLYQLVVAIVERVCITLSEIGPPVLNGGLSTLLAFVLLVFSQSYVFQTFFKVKVSSFAEF